MKKRPSKKQRIASRRVPRRPFRQPGGPGRIVMGLMAGTSADGVDAAAVHIRGIGEAMHVEFLWHRHFPFHGRLRRRLLAVMAPAATRTEELARIHADLGDAFADAAEASIRAARPGERPSLIGLAGQTVCHLPSGRPGRSVTLQLGEPARVAARTGLPTVADFRQSDVAAGGQGAPLVPWTDWILFRHPMLGRAIQNIGGIANVTWIPPAAGPQDVSAFDTGPGNMILDALVNHVSGGRQSMDRDGCRAARGRILPGVLAAWLEHPFLRRRPPKTTGRETFGRAFVESQLPRLRAVSRSPDDWIATATAFTACSIAQAYRRFLPGFFSLAMRRRRAVDEAGDAAGSQTCDLLRGMAHHANSEVIVCGGGARNAALLAMLAAELPGRTIRPIDAYGIPNQAKEAISFALLAAARMDDVPANLPQATGAARRVCLGTVVAP